MELNRDFQEFLQSFVSHDARFLIVGGYALAAHGNPRYTKDLDVWVWAEPTNSTRIMQALTDFGFGDLRVNKRAAGRLRDLADLPPDPA
jgi:hypothetical protein